MSNGCEVLLALGMHICSVLSAGVDDTRVNEHQRSCTHLSAPIGRTFGIEVYLPRIVKTISWPVEDPLNEMECTVAWSKVSTAITDDEI